MLAAAAAGAYAVFVALQTTRARSHFAVAQAPARTPTGSSRETTVRGGVLVALVTPVVLLGDDLAAQLEPLVLVAGAPVVVAGLLVAAVVLAPETVTALRTATAGGPNVP